MENNSTDQYDKTFKEFVSETKSQLENLTSSNGENFCKAVWINEQPEIRTVVFDVVLRPEIYDTKMYSDWDDFRVEAGLQGFDVEVDERTDEEGNSVSTDEEDNFLSMMIRRTQPSNSD